MVARTHRILWKNQRTGWLNHNWNAINGESVVHVVICEGSQEELAGDVLDSIDRFRGAAPMFVKNVHPHNDNGGGVEFFIEIDFGSPLTVVTDITVLDPPEAGFVVN